MERINDFTYNPCGKLEPPPEYEEDIAQIDRDYEEDKKKAQETYALMMERAEERRTMRKKLLFSNPQYSRPVPTIEAAATEIENLYIDLNWKKWTVAPIVKALYAYALLDTPDCGAKNREFVCRRILKKTFLGEKTVPHSTVMRYKEPDSTEICNKVCQVLSKLGFSQRVVY